MHLPWGVHEAKISFQGCDHDATEPVAVSRQLHSGTSSVFRQKVKITGINIFKITGILIIFFSNEGLDAFSLALAFSIHNKQQFWVETESTRIQRPDLLVERMEHTQSFGVERKRGEGPGVRSPAFS
jgi:hypothetical protein